MKSGATRVHNESPFALDPRKPRAPQITSAICQLAVIFGGPALGLVTINHYPLLTLDRSIYLGGIVGILVFSLSTLILFRHDRFLRGLPAIPRIAFRISWGLSSTFLLLGIVGIINGYGTPLEVREVPVVAKHQTLQHDPALRAHYVAVRPWLNSRTVVELDASVSTYEALDVPLDAIDTPQATLDAMPDVGRVSLTVGKGRLGLEWLKGVDPL